MDDGSSLGGAAPARARRWRDARMLGAAIGALALLAGALAAAHFWSGSVLAVSLYKAHLMALGGWGGYWIDRALFPYARPHQTAVFFDARHDGGQRIFAASAEPALHMLRRAVVVAACLVCVGLGA